MEGQTKNTCDLHGDPLGMDGGQVSVLKERHEVGLTQRQLSSQDYKREMGSPSLASWSAKTAEDWKRRSV